MLAVYQLPVILSVRYGIDIWIWLRSVFGLRGVKWISLLIIAINFPWYAVCCDLFASSMENLAGLYGLSLPPGSHLLLELACVLAGTLIACRGIGTITWTTRILVPALLAVGAIVMAVGFRSVPPEVIWNYTPEPGNTRIGQCLILCPSRRILRLSLRWWAVWRRCPGLRKRSGADIWPAFWDRACQAHFLLLWAR